MPPVPTAGLLHQLYTSQPNIKLPHQDLISNTSQPKTSLVHQTTKSKSPVYVRGESADFMSTLNTDLICTCRGVLWIFSRGCSPLDNLDKMYPYRTPSGAQILHKASISSHFKTDICPLLTLMNNTKRVFQDLTKQTDKS